MRKLEDEIERSRSELDASANAQQRRRDALRAAFDTAVAANIAPFVSTKPHDRTIYENFRARLRAEVVAYLNRTNFKRHLLSDIACSCGTPMLDDGMVGHYEGTRYACFGCGRVETLLAARW